MATTVSDQNISRSPAHSQSPVVAFGASAGGLRSLETIFDLLPSDTNIAFVVVQHLSPDFESLMDEILARRTDMPVAIVSEGTAIVPNQVFLIPPGKELRISDGIFRLSNFQSRFHRPIDAFFESLAVNSGKLATAVVLSGTGSDGADGIKAIHEAGGITICESRDSAEFDGMPRSAEATGCLDYVLPANEIPTMLGKILGKDFDCQAEPEPDLEGVNLIFSLLSDQYDIEFEHYKPNTISRRIERRLELCKCESIFDYANMLKEDEGELENLYQDLLIGVTRFFRDTDAFAELEKTIDSQLDLMGADETYRIWVAGCASGEEAYSITMMALDCMARKGRKPLLKVFATDVDQKSLNYAAQGEYDAENLEFVSIERRDQYFDELTDDRYRVTTALRRHIVFACHNVIKDPPFTRIHLVTCRNMLIYFLHQAQASSISSFHFALNERGILFLGSSETPGELIDEFEPINRKWRIYSKIRHRPDLIGVSRKIRGNNSSSGLTTYSTSVDSSAAFSVRRLTDVYESVLREKVPNGFILDNKQNIVHVFGNAKILLQNTEGRFTGNILHFLTGNAKNLIGAALIRAAKDVGTRFTVEDVSIDPADDHQSFDITVQAIAGGRVENLIWLIQLSEEKDATAKKDIKVIPQEKSLELYETELSFTRESLNATIEELELSNEELQATNEEMVASNEELQSTNEELHSVNEELHSVNAEFQRKIDELEETTNDLENLLSTSEIGSIFLDQDLKIRRFTEVITRHFDLLPHDIGRSISRFANLIEYPKLVEDLQEVVATGNPMARMTTDDTGNAMLLKMVPYRAEKRITGVILNVVSNVGFAMESGAGFWEWPDVSKDPMLWSSDCYSLLGYQVGEIPATFSQWKELVHPDDVHKLNRVGSTRCSFVKNGFLSVRMKHKTNVYRPFTYRGVFEISEDGNPKTMMGSFTHDDEYATTDEKRS